MASATAATTLYELDSRLPQIEPYFDYGGVGVPIVLDNGSYEMRAGFASSRDPARSSCRRP